MKRHEIEALENIHPGCLSYGCNGYINLVVQNVGGIYRGKEFLLELTKKAPWIFKLYCDFNDRTIPPEVYINAGIHSERGELLSYFINNEYIKNYINLEIVELPQIIELHWNALEYWSKFAKQEKWVEMAVELRADSLQFASDNLRNSKEFVSKLLLKQPSCFKHASDNLRNDISVALPAVIMHEPNFKYVGRNTLKNYELCHFAVIKNPNNIKYLNDSNPFFESLMEIAIRQGVDKAYLPLKKRKPKKVFDKVSLKATLNLSYGATPPRLLIFKNLEEEKIIIKLVLVVGGEYSEFRLKCNKIKNYKKEGSLFNIDLRDGFGNSRIFKEWQDKVSEKGTLEVSIKNVGVVFK
jgi:hypothetical protein